MLIYLRNIYIFIIFLIIGVASSFASIRIHLLDEVSLSVQVNILQDTIGTYSDPLPSYDKLVDSIGNVKVKKDVFIPNSKKALLWGLLPGGGQIYNQKYWKLPIVWGAFTTCVYAMRFNQQRYTEYHDAYRDMSSSDPSKNTAWLAFTPRGTKPEDYQKYKYLLDNFRRGDEFFHRWRDISIVATIGVYALSMIDAYVDAELATFDISPDLSMKIYPKLEPSVASNLGYNFALGCSLNF